jgi:predicted metal-dependent hydrolase
VDERGLVVQTPWRTSDHYIDRVLREGTSWIIKKLANWRASAPRPRRWQSGEYLDFLGEQVRIEVIQDSGAALVQLHESRRLEVRSPTPQDASTVRQVLIKWYQRHAQSHFAQRLDYYTRQLNLRKKPTLRLSSATTRWGSCNVQREIRLNWRLMQAPSHIIDYVVAHEVAHMLELNHSARFWRLVGQLCPDYPRARAELDALTRHYMSL